MPLLTPPHLAIEVEVADRIVADTVVKQKARFVSLVHEQHPQAGVCFVRLKVLVSLYVAQADGSFGPLLPPPVFIPYPVDLVADNRSIVSLATGKVLATQTTEYADEWQAIIDAIDEPAMYQGDYFEYAREHESLSIGDLIREHIEAANQPPFNRFS